MLTLAFAMTLGVVDTGIFSDLDDRVTLALPKIADPSATVDERHRVIVLWDGARPVKVYPSPLRPADAAELAPILGDRPMRRAAARPDADGDGIPDALDILIGAKKVA